MVHIDRQSMKRAELFKIAGRIDSSNSLQLESALNDCMDEGKYRLVLDLSEVDYMSSSALRAMVSALRNTKKHRGDVFIAAPSERVVEVLSLAGLDSLFTIYDDVTQAVGDI